LEEVYAGMKKSRVLKSVIKHRETEKYYAGNGAWTDESDQAMKFYDLVALVEEISKYQIRDCCEVILSYDKEPGINVYLPL